MEYEQGNYSAAFLTFQRVAEDGDARAQNALGDMYFLGEGAEQNIAAAVHWYIKAANQGVATAQYRLADLHVQGIGVAQSDVDAWVWYSLSGIFSSDESHSELVTALRNRIGWRLTPSALADARRRLCDWWRTYQQSPPDPALGICASE